MSDVIITEQILEDIESSVREARLALDGHAPNLADSHLIKALSLIRSTLPISEPKVGTVVSIGEWSYTHFFMKPSDDVDHWVDSDGDFYSWEEMKSLAARRGHTIEIQEV